MDFPLSLWDVTQWLAIIAIILLITSEVISSYHGKINLLISKKRLQYVAMVISALFLIMVAIRIATIGVGS